MARSQARTPSGSITIDGKGEFLDARTESDNLRLVYGHKIVILIGGATGSIERPLLDVEIVEKNNTEIRALVHGILHGANKETELKMGFPKDEILNLDSKDAGVGRYSRVGTMMAKKSVNKRLMSEFIYQLWNRNL